MNYASEDLRNEHEGILFGLRILDVMVHQLSEKKIYDINDIEGMINFLKLFADKCHHGKEEGLLFPAMEKSGIQNENGPIGQMLIEHEQGRKYIAEMSESISSGVLQESNFIQAATGYINLMRTHIVKENMILFPLGDKMMLIDVQEQLLQLFKTFEEEVMGKGTHEKLHEMLHNFEHKYL